MNGRVERCSSAHHQNILSPLPLTVRRPFPYLENWHVVALVVDEKDLVEDDPEEYEAQRRKASIEVTFLQTATEVGARGALILAPLGKYFGEGSPHYLIIDCNIK